MSADKIADNLLLMPLRSQQTIKTSVFSFKCEYFLTGTFEYSLFKIENITTDTTD